MKLRQPTFQRCDDRGCLSDIRGDWKQVNILEIKKDKTLGGHYHKVKTELFYVVRGLVLFTIATKTTNEHQILADGEMLVVDPYDQHTLTAIEDATVIELISHEYNENDTFKYGEDNG